MKQFDLFQSFIGKQQKSFLSPIAIPFDAGWNTNQHCREYELFKKIYKQRENNPRPWGLVSWKFNQKNSISIEKFSDYVDLKLSAGYQCVAINPMIANEATFFNVWEQGMRAHKTLKAIVEYFEGSALKLFDINAVHGKNLFCFCNYFVATPLFWKNYFIFVDKVTDLLDEQAKLRTKAGQAWIGPAGYIGDKTVSLRPFVIERLLSSYLHKLDKSEYIVFQHRREDFHIKFGRNFGDFLYQFSISKNASLSNAREFKKWNDLRLKFFKTNLCGAALSIDDSSIFPRLTR